VSQKRGRTHETLVNDFSSWLIGKGFEVGRNAATDLGIVEPPVIFEAKIVANWPRAIREAVGQLYVYRYFKVVDPDAALIFLASKPVPANWTAYLERDRKIGVAWRTAKSFELSRLARRSLDV
jgi:hypothetical protein